MNRLNRLETILEIRKLADETEDNNIKIILYTTLGVLNTPFECRFVVSCQNLAKEVVEIFKKIEKARSN